MLLDVIDWGDFVCSANWQSFDDGGLFHKLYYVKGGKAFYTDDECKMTLLPENLYLLPMYKRFRVRHLPENPFHVTWLHLEYSRALSYKPIKYTPAKSSLLYETLTLLQKFIHAEKISLLLPLAEIIMTLLAEESDFISAASNNLGPVLELLQSTGNAKILSNQELAHLSGYSKSHLVRLFHQELGITPRQYQLQGRLNRAKKMLRQGMAPYLVANNLGFSSPAAFGRDFKAAYNISPGQYQLQGGRP